MSSERRRPVDVEARREDWQASFSVLPSARSFIRRSVRRACARNTIAADQAQLCHDVLTAAAALSARERGARKIAVADVVRGWNQHLRQKDPVPVPSPCIPMWNCMYRTIVQRVDVLQSQLPTIVARR